MLACNSSSSEKRSFILTRWLVFLIGGSVKDPTTVYIFLYSLIQSTSYMEVMQYEWKEILGKKTLWLSCKIIDLLIIKMILYCKIIRFEFVYTKTSISTVRSSWIPLFLIALLSLWGFVCFESLYLRNLNLNQFLLSAPSSVSPISSRCRWTSFIHT